MAKKLKYIVVAGLAIAMLIAVWMFGQVFIYCIASLIKGTAYAPNAATIEGFIFGALTFGALHTFFRCLRFLKTGVEE